MKPTKDERAAAIAKCVEMIAQHCEVPALHLIDHRNRRGQDLREAKALLVYHLKQCGMSTNAIGRMLHRSDDYVQKISASCAVRMLPEDRALMETLPKIPSSLKITRI